MSTCIQYDICDAHHLYSFCKSNNKNNNYTVEAGVSLCNSVTLVTFFTDEDRNVDSIINSKNNSTFTDSSNTNECKRLIHNV